jgi:hypothetical protein
VNAVLNPEIDTAATPPGSSSLSVTDSVETVKTIIFAAPYAVDLYNWLKIAYGKDRAAEVKLSVQSVR